MLNSNKKSQNKAAHVLKTIRKVTGPAEEGQTILKLDGVKIGKKNLYLEHDDAYVLRLGASGPSMPLEQLLKTMPKGVRREFRKSLRASGHADLAACPTGNLPLSTDKVKKILAAV